MATKKRVNSEALPSGEDKRLQTMTREMLEAQLGPLRMFTLVRTPNHTNDKGEPELVTHVEAHAIEHDKGALYFSVTTVEVMDAFGHFGYNRRIRYGAAPGTWVDFREENLYPNAN